MSEQSLRPSAAARVLAYVNETVSIMNDVRNTKFKLANDTCEVQKIAAEQAGIAAYNDAYNQGEATQLQAFGQIASAGISLGGDAIGLAGPWVYSKMQGKNLEAQLKNVESWENQLNKSENKLLVAPAGGDEEKALSPKTFFNRIKSGDLTSRGPSADEIGELNTNYGHEEFEKFERRVEKLKDSLNTQKDRNEQQSIRLFDKLDNFFRNAGSAVNGGYLAAMGEKQKEGAAFKMASAIWEYVKNTLNMLESQFYDSANKDTDNISGAIHSVDAIYDTNKA